jgi:hypothetical protein
MADKIRVVLRRVLRGRPRPCVAVLTMIAHPSMLEGLLQCASWDWNRMPI